MATTTSQPFAFAKSAPSWAVVVSGLLKESGFIDIEVKKDLTGFDRLIHCRKKAVEEEESKS